MPPWVAQQCHVLRGLKPASARVYCLRSYSQRSDHLRLQQLQSINTAIIIPSSVVETNPEDLIQHIKPVCEKNLTRDRFAVFLVTPSFAPWLLDDAAFVRKALGQAYVSMLEGATTPYARVHALCAVVDKLPAPVPLQSFDDPNGLENVVQLRTKQPPVDETGYEGMAYATLRFSDSVLAPSPLPGDQAAISFVVPETSKASTGHFGDTLRLPLANTVFQTGRPSTMIYSTWEKAKGATEFTLKSKNDSTHHGIKIHPDTLGDHQSSALAIPLVPLTKPRQVEASMGNILRRVIGPEGNSMLASHELERAVPQFYSARHESSQATNVWALVMSKETLRPILSATNSMLGRLPDEVGVGLEGTDAELWDRLWIKEPAAWNGLVPNALAAGARLHRVLSGGGGWGKKAGLLSLDPVSATDTTPSENDMFDGPGDLASVLQQVARDGDFIQFFISPSNSTQASVDQLAKLKEIKISDKTWSWELGTIPSTADAIPAGSWQHDPSTPKETFVFHHSFGALTEAGMTVSRHFKLDPTESFSLVGGTKVDVPFSRFSALNIGSDTEVSGEDSMHDYLAAQPLPYHPVLIKRLYGEETPSFLGLPRPETLPEENAGIFEDEEEYDGLSEEPDDVHGHTANMGELRTHSSIAEDRTKSAEKGTRLATRTYPSITHHGPTQIYSPVGFADPQTTPNQTKPFKVRYLPTVETSGDRLAYLASKTRHSTMTIQRLSYEARKLMRIVRRRRGEEMNIFFRDASLQSTQKARSNTKPDPEVVPPGKKSLSPHYVKNLNETANASEAQLYALQKAFKELMSEVTQTIFDQLEARVGEIAATVRQSRREIQQLLICADIPRMANESATDVYNVHIELRGCYGAMIRYRQRNKHPHPLARGIMPLEKKLVTLRSFTGDLFYRATRAVRQQQQPSHIEHRAKWIREYLMNLEAQHPSLKGLILSDAARRVEARNKLSMKEQEVIRKAKMLRKAERGEKGVGLKANNKLRWVFDDETAEKNGEVEPYQKRQTGLEKNVEQEQQHPRGAERRKAELERKMEHGVFKLSKYDPALSTTEVVRRRQLRAARDASTTSTEAEIDPRPLARLVQSRPSVMGWGRISPGYVSASKQQREAESEKIRQARSKEKRSLLVNTVKAWLDIAEDTQPKVGRVFGRGIVDRGEEEHGKGQSSGEDRGKDGLWKTLGM